MASIPAELCEWVKAQLIAKSTFVVLPENVIIGESGAFEMDSDETYPRLEFQIVGSNRTDYVEQRVQNRTVTISIQGYIRRESSAIIDQDMYDIADFEAETGSAIFNILDQRQFDPSLVPQKFIKLSPHTESFIVYEESPQLSSFLFNFTAEFGACDTY